jgi:gliding motility-associated-like protein
VVSAINGCESSDSILVEDERTFPEIEVEDFYLPCNGDAEQVFTSFISEGSFVRWFGPNNYFSQEDTAFVIEAGEYIGIAFNPEGCTTSDTFQVIDEPVYPVFNGFSELLLCLGPVPITATDIEDDGSFYWNGPNNFYSETNPALVDEPGTYQLVVTTKKGCVDSMAIEVIDGRIFPDAVASLNGLFQCENLEVNLSGEGSSTGNIFTYNWTTEDGIIIQGDNTLNPKINQEGTYIIEVLNNNIGCASYDTLIVVLQEQDLKGAEIEVVKPTCLGFGNGQIILNEIIGGYGPYNIFVDDFDYGERMDIEYLVSGEHLVTVVDSLGCHHDTLVIIPEEGLLSLELPSDTTLNLGDSILIQATITLSPDSIKSIVWSSNIPCDGCSEILLFPNQNITISVEVTDINGCMAEDELNITINRPNNLPFPQIFSPNGDNINDVFYMPMTKGLVDINYLKIYDNWGGLLYFQKNLIPGDASNGWDGTVNGQNAEIAVYIVEALVTLVDGSEIIYVGDLTLIR